MSINLANNLFAVVLLFIASVNSYSDSTIFVGYVESASVMGKEIIADVNVIKSIKVENHSKSNLVIRFNLADPVTVGGYYIFEVKDSKGAFYSVQSLSGGILLNRFSGDRGDRGLILKNYSLRRYGYFEIAGKVYFPDDCSRGAIELCIHFQSYIEESIKF